ncbi:MAG TPA: hypothetical protein VMW75_28725 [Thermoanaerobaculia bacterium]|nr:hypothetical protein [Thermoanaerobaculia bacterium]
MGDRTTVWIEVLASARPSVEEAFCQQADDDLEGELPGTVRLAFNDVDGGGFDLLCELARSGIVFRGSHDDGIEYPGMTFAAHDGTFAETRSWQGELVVEIDPTTCEPRASDLAAARHWRQIDDQVIASFTRCGH